MDAMIFAAGLGTRLKPLTDDRPKAMVQVNSLPLIGHAILNLKHQGVKRITVNVHHFAKQITAYLESENWFDLDIQISDETDQLLDTGGGLKKAIPLFDPVRPLIVCNVDILTNLDINAMMQVHNHSNAIATLAIRNRPTSRYFIFNKKQNLVGWKNVKTGELKMSREARQPTPIAFSGFQIISPKLFNYMDQTGKFSIVATYLEIAKRHKIKGYLHNDDYWLDVGKHDTLKVANTFIKSMNPNYLVRN